VTNPPGFSAVTGWADCRAALEGQNVYVVCHQTDVGSWRYIEGRLEGKVDENLFEKGTVLGTGYIWDRQERSQGAFIPWQTDGNLLSADEWSGSPLCLGASSEPTPRVVAFQNFQRRCLIGKFLILARKYGSH
jgi:hypothetical protein